ncbi:uracil phosphoribosyltransferase [Mytilinidion resinicola]|uniref:Uracil phosphoribosyltransferase n=1 Tax=Mytilinidion resinicola TaxID=574789 RepID=A0A6A6XXX3_9PEZI|nr:uracil phosphoribosyltransferase [Mytilinidion resinicola]KAF2801280.1 uracil phosphoribosyltransferase [Mytilinidion resinicola]
MSTKSSGAPTASSSPFAPSDPRAANLSDASSSSTTTTTRPTIIGIYGLPGAGKTHLLNYLEQHLDPSHFSFFDGSQSIASVVPGGLAAFHTLSPIAKTDYRKKAIDRIRGLCAERGKAGIVAGHYMFWTENKGPQYCCTKDDLNTYTHIIYLDVPPAVVKARQEADTARERPRSSVEHLRKWQGAEMKQLRDLCRKHEILFARLERQENVLEHVAQLIKDFQAHSEAYNTTVVEGVIDEVMETQFPGGTPRSVLVIDGDRTLAPQDTGSLFYEKLFQMRRESATQCPLRTLFSSSMGYSYTAFRQATLLYQEAVDEHLFDVICRDVALGVTMYPEFVSLLHAMAGQDHVGAVVVSCGLRRVWEELLKREGLSDTVKVVGGGRLSNGYVVTPAVKAAVVSRLRSQTSSKGLTKVWAFGDSPMDIPMLQAADEAVVVVGEEKRRSKTMDEALRTAIDEDGLMARQVVLPSTAPPRLDIKKLPLFQITSLEFIDSINLRPSKSAVEIIHATNRTAAKLLMTQTRDASISGPALREAHRCVGWYLATEFLSDLVGVEECPIPHVQGNQTTGSRLYHETQTLIVPLMRGGEPMAFGVNDAFPKARFLHAKEAQDVKLENLEDQVTVVLVDSVINSGNSIMKFVERIRELHATVRIVIMAGVVQADAVSEDVGSLKCRLSVHGRISLVALRVSQNKYTGSGVTDTGNRLFNTTHLP